VKLFTEEVTGLARNRANVNRRRKKGGKSPLIPLVVIILLIVGVFFALEQVKKLAPQKPAPAPPVVERHRMPPREGAQQAVQKPVTTAVPKQSPAPAPEPTQPRHQKATGSGNVAIIIDDMGSSEQEVRELMAIDVPLTFSIIPGLSRMRQVAEDAHRKGYQVMIHVPMEPQGYPQQRLEQNGLLLSQSDAEITERVNGFLASVPYAVGANNHMGSRFTEDKAKMRLVLGLLKGRGMYFVDSRTTPKSFGYPLARGMGMETATRDVFLDNVQDGAAIKRQLEQLTALARKRGSAIGICHPHKATIQALAAALPAYRQEGINFVFASEVVK
jgi:polysaccharide deacetylase 2 family uncharacterized protein YibQ